MRDEYARVVASLVRRFGDVDVAEEAVGEALLVAVQAWPQDGVPANPGGWLVTVAGNRALDRLRREARGRQKLAQVAVSTRAETPEPIGAIGDDRLRLVFMCAHPALALDSRVALTLRLVAGLSVAEIAQAFLVPETTMAQRLTRAKRKIRLARIPFRVPLAEDLQARLAGVLRVVYLVFNEGYLATSGDSAIRGDLCAEAIRLGRLLADALPGEPEVDGLLALMLLIDARRPARVRDGVLVRLDEQDRSLWDRALIEEGHAIVRRCLAGGRPGRYQVNAAINAAHTDAATAEATDWAQIVALYDLLLALDPSPVVALNRSVAIAELDGAMVALATVDALELTTYLPWHVTRADLLRRCGRGAEAAQAYETALAMCENPAEAAFLRGRRATLETDVEGGDRIADVPAP